MPSLKRPLYVFDPRLRNGLGAYRSIGTGRIVSNNVVRSTLFDYIDYKTTDELSRRLISREISLAQWQQEMRYLISDGHLTSYALAKGGWDQLTNEDFRLLGEILTREYRYLDRFAAEVAEGSFALDGRLRVRAGLYEEQFYSTYAFAEARVQEFRGATEERSVLDPGADHCGTCIAEAAKGWIPIGTGLPIGGRECLSRCRCHKEYR